MSRNKQDWSLPQWLDHIQTLHPTEIELGLARVRQVAQRLDIPLNDGPRHRLARSVITVAGTNGKGSCVAMLESILRAAGLRTGTYTSPHILRYNERIMIAGEEASDQALCSAFLRIDKARQEISLSYFEYSTLAGLLLFAESGLDVVILEVGLGGRLDAVNIVDADIAIIASIDLDHQDWLGDTRELIGYEKAGIIRTGQPVVCGDRELPASIAACAGEKQARLYQLGRDFDYSDDGQGWEFRYTPDAASAVTCPQLPHPGLDLFNAATVMAALQQLGELAPDSAAISKGLQQVRLPGRFQRSTDPDTGREVILDVAHNPQAGRNLAAKLQALKTANQQNGQNPRIHLVLAMMHDKDHESFFESLENTVDFWYIAHFDQPRCQPAEKLLHTLQARAANSSAEAAIAGPFSTVREAYQAAAARAEENDIIVAGGSFFTVAAMMQVLAETTPCSDRR